MFAKFGKVEEGISYSIVGETESDVTLTIESKNRIVVESLTVKDSYLYLYKLYNKPEFLLQCR